MMRELVYISVEADINANLIQNKMEALRKRFAEQGLPFAVCDSLEDIFHEDRLVGAFLTEYNQQTVMRLINDYSVDRIYVSDLDGMLQDLKTVDRTLQRDNPDVLQGLMHTEKELRRMQEHLTDALKKQQYSYNKLHTLYDIVFAHLTENDSRKCEMIHKWFDLYLRMYTTGAVDMTHFEEEVQNDLASLQEQYPGFVVEQTQNRLGNVSRTTAANIRFLIYLIAEYSCLVSKRCSYQVTSEYLTPNRVRFQIKSKLESDHHVQQCNEETTNLTIKDLIDKILALISDTVEFTVDEHQLFCSVELSTIA